VIALAFALVAVLPIPQAQSAKSPARTGAPVRIDCAVDEPRIATRASAIADAAWKETCSLFDLEPAAGIGPYDVHLDANVTEYNAACDKLLRGKFKKNLAVTIWNPLSVHVVLQPTVRGDALHALAPTVQTLRLVAHEVAHLARYASLPSYRDQPGWLKDGAATWIASRVLASQGLSKEPEQSPFSSTNVVRVQRLLRDGRLPGVDDLLHDRTGALEFYDRYAARWLLFRFLVEGERARAFRGFLVDLRSIGGGDGCVDRCGELLKERLAVDAWSALDDGFRRWIAALKPEWDQSFVSLEPAGDEWTQSSFDDANAVAFRTAPAGPKPYAIEGSVTTLIDRNDQPQANLLLGRIAFSDGQERFVSVALVPGSGATVFDYDSSRAADSQWMRLARVAANDSAAGRPLAFAVKCTPKTNATELELKLAGKVVATCTVERVLDGPWGVGAQAGSSCVWHKVHLVAGAGR
jgi:hypothetical protein